MVTQEYLLGEQSKLLCDLLGKNNIYEAKFVTQKILNLLSSHPGLLKSIDHPLDIGIALSSMVVNRLLEDEAANIVLASYAYYCLTKSLQKDPSLILLQINRAFLLQLKEYFEIIYDKCVKTSYNPHSIDYAISNMSISHTLKEMQLYDLFHSKYIHIGLPDLGKLYQIIKTEFNLSETDIENNLSKYLGFHNRLFLGIEKTLF